MIEVDGIIYSADQVEEAIRDRKRLQEEVKRLTGPFTCDHDPRYAGGACAACHAVWIEKAEVAEKALDVSQQQFAALLGEAMRQLCLHPDDEECTKETCPGASFGKWAIRELVPSTFVGKSDTRCPECSGSIECLSDGEVPCQMCGGSGDRSTSIKQGPKKCSKCGKENSTVTRAVFIKKPEWPYLCHNCDRELSDP